jgi:8-oxo-dGTP pyrophosphatase MutT (NUDIX family)
MSDERPKITRRHTTAISPWMKVVERDVVFAPGEEPQTYYAVDQADYVAIVARTPSGQIPIVRQFRPALEQFTWELPAGLVDEGEDPAESCRRELMEETGLPARTIHALGTAAPCSGRLSNRIHSFFVETGEPVGGFQPERGLEVRLVGLEDHAGLIRSGAFVSQLHLGALLLAELHGYLTLHGGRK